MISPGDAESLQWYSALAGQRQDLPPQDSVLDVAGHVAGQEPKGTGDDRESFEASDTVGDAISNELFTAVCGSEGDQTILIGHCNNQKQVEEALREDDSAAAARPETETGSRTPPVSDAGVGVEIEAYPVSSPVCRYVYMNTYPNTCRRDRARVGCRAV